MFILFFGFLFNVVACAINVAAYSATGNPINLLCAIVSGACALWLGVLAASDY